MPSIEKRGENTWRLTVEVGYNSDGERLRERKVIKIEDQTLLKTTKKLRDYLESEWHKFKNEVESGAYIRPGKMTLSKFTENEWKTKYANYELSPTTFKVYCEHLDNRILPAFGHETIDKITTIQIVTFLKNLQKPGARKDGRGEYLEISTIQYTYRVMKNVFKRAKEWKFISNDPMDGVIKPQLPKDARVVKAKEQKKKPNYYSEDEAQQVVDALYSESKKWRLMILGSLIGGFRRGELVGLEWPNVKFEEDSIEVENNIPLSERGQPIEKGPKSISSYRIVDMPDWYMNEMETYREEWEKEKNDLGNKWEGEDRQFVFHNGYGRPYYYQHPSRWWERFCKRHNIRYITFHGLRHSMGTLLIEDDDPSNVDSILKVIQDRLGHSRKSTTEDIYVHVTKKVKKRTAGKFDKFARSTENSSPKLKRIK